MASKFNDFFEKTRKIVITPVAALQHQTPMTFYVPGSESLWMDLYNSFFEFRVRIVKEDNSNIAAVATDDVGPINNLMHSMFSTVDIELGGKPVSDQNALYPYRAYLDSLLLSSKESLKSKGQMALFEMDKAGSMVQFSSKNDGANTGLVQRRAMMRVGGGTVLMGKLFTDLFQMNSPIFPGVSLKIKLTPSKDAFVIVSPAADPQPQYKLLIDDARFHLKMLEATSTFSMQSEKTIQSDTWKYLLTRKTLKHFSIPTGQTSSMIDNIYLGERPDRIIMVMVADAAMSGGYQQNPFNFEHDNLNNLSLTFNGTTIMGSPYTMDFANDDYINMYNGACEALGILNQSNKGFNITRSDYKKGFTVFAFDLTTDPNPIVSDPPRNGTIRLELKFGAATPATLNIILLAEYNATIEVDRYLNVITNFA